MTESDRQTEDKIFDAASTVFEERGMDGARMQEIANRAGINKALLHYYFRTKELLFEAVFQKLAGKLFSRFAPLLNEGMTLEEKIVFFYNEHIEFMKNNPRLPAFIISEINRNPARIKKVVMKVDTNSIWEILEKQHREELKKYNITKEVVPQLMSSIAALSVFPFAAHGLLEGIFESFGVDFSRYLEERKKFAPEFVIGALKSRIKK
jgi:AcrR family transcriptional regulator